MEQKVTGFLYESPTKKSSKRLLALIFSIYSMMISTLVYILSEDYVALVAVWGAVTGTVLILIGVGKHQENETKKIANGHNPKP